MKSLNLKWAVTVIVSLTILIWLIVLNFKGIWAAGSWEAIKEIPTIAGYITLIALWFTRWGWRWRCFKGWLVLVPNLNGTWKGELRSQWVDPKIGQRIAPQEAYLVIKQTLFETCCCQMTNESKSYSRGVIVCLAPADHLRVLQFIYSNSPQVSVQDRSRAHDGACSLEIIEGSERKLVGKYWTERNTKGELEFKFFSKGMRQEF